MYRLATSNSTVAKNSTARVPGSVMPKPRIVRKLVKPLLPPKPVSLRKNSSIPAKVRAWVMIEKYTPLIRERKAKKPNTKASNPGAKTTRHRVQRKLLVPVQNHGISVHDRKVMNAGKPSPEAWRIRYMPMA
ncbi:hypothetical protein D3C81_1859470 [compost metagenome]